MTVSPLHNFTCVLSTINEVTSEISRFIFVSRVVDLTWNIELGFQGEEDRWWRGSVPLPDVITQSEVQKRLSASDVRVKGWKGTQDKCMLKLVFDLPQLRKLSISLKEYSSEESCRRAMYLLFEASFGTGTKQIGPESSKGLEGISAGELKLSELEQTIKELRRKINLLEQTLASRLPPVAPTIPRKIPSIPIGASLANPSKRRRLIKDMRFDGE